MEYGNTAFLQWRSMLFIINTVIPSADQFLKTYLLLLPPPL